MKQPIPRTIAGPPLHMKSPWSAGAHAYESLAALDPGLLPEDAVNIARLSHNFAALAPKPSRARADAIVRWRQDLHDSVRSAKPEVPSTAAMIAAMQQEQISRELGQLFTSEWNNTINPLGRILASHGDDIVAELRVRHDQSWAAFVAAHELLAGIESAEAMIGRPELASAWQNAASALATFYATRLARVRLQEIRQYAVTGASEAAVLFYSPEAFKASPAKATQLETWHHIAATYPEARPWMPNQAQLAQHIEDQGIGRIDIGSGWSAA
ncbi:MAG: hypothetical protein WCP28_07195 [Actinomycetes bacterium]